MPPLPLYPDGTVNWDQANYEQARDALYPSSGNSAEATASTAAQIANIENITREMKRQADREYQLKKDEVNKTYQVSLMNARTAQERNEIERWYQGEQVRLAGERLAQEQRIADADRAEKARQFDITSAEGQRQFNLNFNEGSRQFDERLAYDKARAAEQLGLNQAQLGYSLINQQANLRGPSNYFQAAEYARGVAAQPQTATFLGALQSNTKLAPYGAQAGIPDRETVNTLSAKLGGPTLMPGTSAGSGYQTNDAANLATIGNLYAAGAHKLGAGSLEQLTDTELALLKSGIDASGGDWSTFMDQYGRSRIGQGSGGAYNAA